MPTEDSLVAYAFLLHVLSRRRVVHEKQCRCRVQLTASAKAIRSDTDDEADRGSLCLYPYASLAGSMALIPSYDEFIIANIEHQGRSLFDCNAD